MTLTTHTLVAGAATVPFIGVVSPLGLFAVALASHYAVDTIPHCDYELRHVGLPQSTVAAHDSKYAAVLYDLSRVGLDFLLGSTLLLAISKAPLELPALLPYAAIVFGAVLPDLLQALRWLFPTHPLTRGTQAVHNFFHARDLPQNFVSISSQLIFTILAGLLLYTVAN